MQKGKIVRCSAKTNKHESREKQKTTTTATATTVFTVFTDFSIGSNQKKDTKQFSFKVREKSLQIIKKSK